MKNIRIYMALVLGIAIMTFASCTKDPKQTPEEYVKDLPRDKEVVGFWMGYVYGEVKSISGKEYLTITDTSTIYNGISEFQSGGADFAYRLKKENGEYIHSYDPSSKSSQAYWYSGKSGAETVVYDVYAQAGAEPSTRVDFEYRVFNTDTLITADYVTGDFRILVRLADPSKIPDSLKIQK